MLMTRWTPRLLLLATLAALAAGPLLRAPGGSVLRPVLLVLVLALGWVVATYAATNLRGQRHRERFAALLLTTVGGLALMVAASPLWLAAAGWTASGLALSALVAHRDDAAAHRAAALVRRRLLLGDVALWAAVAVEALGVATAAVGTLLALAAVVRSALVPAQRWLPETAEAPSPVSALLHAGVVNGGPMLLLLHWPLVTGTPAHAVLLVAGAASVVVGLATQRLRADVKGRLAASTSTQMGLVAVQLGLGLPLAAATHVVGHGCWKAWLFLRAGGSAGRARPAAAPALRAPAVLGAVLAGAAVLGTGLLLAPALAAETAEVAFSAGVAALLAAAAGLEAVRLERTSAARRAVAGGAVLLPLLAYVAAVTALAATAHAWFPGTDPAPVPVALLAVALLGAAGLAAARWSTTSDSAAAGALAATLLPPHARVRGRVGAVLARTDVPPTLGGLPLAHAGTVADLAAAAVGPAWPLHSLVASNPLAALEAMGVEDAASVVRRLHGRDPRPRLSTFLDLHAHGIVGTTALRRALAESDPAGPLAGVTVDDLVAFTRSVAAAGTGPEGAPLRARACDGAPAGGARPVAEVLELQAAAWTARAWGGEPGSDPWTLWLTSARRTGHDLAWRVRGTTALARALPDDPATALAVLWPRVQPLTGGQDFFTYAACQLTSGRGWAAHARWRAREAGSQEPVLQLLALRTALDLVLAEAAGTVPPAAAPVPPPQSEHAASAAGLVAVWQRALDLAARDGLVRGLTAATAPAAGPARPRVQSTWCIDARSEPVRRGLEALGGHETAGYAGFFGAPVRHTDADGRTATLVPGLLSPALDTCQRPGALGTLEALHRVVTRAGRHPAAAFAHAEVSGLPALGATLAATLRPAALRRLARRVAGPAPYERVEGLPTEVALDVAEAFLRTTGIGAAPAEVLVLVGHGSSTENNAFASAYDCGACGGHAGDVSASLVARALEDPDVRAGLARRGLPLPEGTVAVAALHDTTVDEVRLLRSGAETPARRALLDAVQGDLDRAGLAAATRRLPQLPGTAAATGRDVRRALAARAADWAEPMPEWGLAGNLALVVGPRSLTRDLDLGGTAFLHSYDAALDPDGSVLTAVLTGPVLVTQWIHAQYDATVSAPDLLGAGDKTTHNVVGDVGVLTGAHGDLRTGLPWQAVSGHDPADPRPGTSSMRHLPARHLVVVAAAPAAVRRVVEQHRALGQVVGGGWVQLLALDPATGALLELDRSLAWQPCPPLGLPRRPAAAAPEGAAAPAEPAADAAS